MVCLFGFEDMLQLQVDIDCEKVNVLGFFIFDVNVMLQIVFGLFYVNNYIDMGCVQKVYVQLDVLYCMMFVDFGDWYVKVSSSVLSLLFLLFLSIMSMIGYDFMMVFFLLFVKSYWMFGLLQIECYNWQFVMGILVVMWFGVSIGEVMMVVEQFVCKLLFGFVVEWMGQLYQEKQVGL